MATVKDLVSKIRADLEMDILSYGRIAEKHGVPLDFVGKVAEEMRHEQEAILDAAEDAAYERNYSRR